MLRIDVTYSCYRCSEIGRNTLTVAVQGTLQLSCTKHDLKSAVLAKKIITVKISFVLIGKLCYSR